MALSFISTRIKDGSILADLKDLQMQQGLPLTMMRYEAQSAKMPLDSAPVNWRSATEKYEAAVICLGDDAVTPLWGGYILDRTTDETDMIGLSLATPEVYLDSVYAGDEKFTNVDQNLIIKQLVEKYVSGPDGIPLRVQIVGSTGVLRQRTVTDTEDKTIYSIMQDLSGVIGGPEWTIGWERTGTRYTPVLYVGTRIGNAATPGLGTNVSFELPGSVTKAQLVESYKSGDGANNVMATSSGMGDARPQSPRQTPLAGYGNKPRVEYRWTPSTSITTISTLTDHAKRALKVLADGSSALTLSVNRQEARGFNIDWSLGDDVEFNLTTRAWPETLKGVGRVIGVQIEDDMIIPIIDASSLGPLQDIQTGPTPGNTIPEVYPAGTLFPSSITFPS